MNNARRKEIRNVVDELAVVAVRVEESGDELNVDILSNARNSLLAVSSDEESAMYNTPDNLQGTVRFQNLEINIDYINDATNYVEEAQKNIKVASDNINKAIDLLLSVQ